MCVCTCVFFVYFCVCVYVVVYLCACMCANVSCVTVTLLNTRRVQCVHMCVHVCLYVCSSLCVLQGRFGLAIHGAAPGPAAPASGARIPQIPTARASSSGRWLLLAETRSGRFAYRFSHRKPCKRWLMRCVVSVMCVCMRVVCVCVCVWVRVCARGHRGVATGPRWCPYDYGLFASTRKTLALLPCVCWVSLFLNVLSHGHRLFVCTIL